MPPAGSPSWSWTGGLSLAISTNTPSPGISTSRPCPTSTCSCARPVSSGPATSSCGSRPTPRWSSWTRSGPISTGATCGVPLRSMPLATDATAVPWIARWVPAEELTALPPASSARLVLMCGPPGSGKTTLARLLVKQLPAVGFSPDEWMTQLGVALDHPLRDPLGELQWRLAQELLVNGQSVILDSGHWMRSERDQKRLAARALGVRVELQFLDVPLHELHRRVGRRTAEGTWGAYPMAPEELDRWRSFFEPPDAEEVALFDPPSVLASTCPGQAAVSYTHLRAHETR